MNESGIKLHKHPAKILDHKQREKERRKTYIPDLVFSAGLESLQSITAVLLEWIHYPKAQLAKKFIKMH